MTSRLAAVLLASAAVALSAQPRPLPILDMHLHADAADSQGPPRLGMCTPLPPLARDPREPWPDAFNTLFKKPPCADPIWSAATDDELMTQTIEVLRRRNVFGVASGPPDHVRRWRAAEPQRIIPALLFGLGPQAPSVAEVQRAHENGEIAVFGEVINQYAGITADDSSFEPYLAMAEARDLPVGIHVGLGPPGAAYLGYAKYRARFHSALALEEPLLKHPKLRLYAMHAGWPMIDDMLAVLYAHPQVYVDLGVIDYILPRAEFHRYLQRLVEAGFGKRVMFGSDQMVWPGAIERALANIDAATFLTAEQKRDILYNNAVRFLRLSDAEVARHHGR